MDVIVEEELEIMADPVQVGERIQAKTGDFYANTCDNTSEIHRVRKDITFLTSEPTDKVMSAESAQQGGRKSKLGGSPRPSQWS